MFENIDLLQKLNYIYYIIIRALRSEHHLVDKKLFGR